MTTRTKGFQQGHKHSEETKRRIGDALRRVVSYNCDNCNTVAFTTPSVFAKKKRHFCSTKCYTNYRREYLSKEEHNAYGHGLSIEERKLRAWCRSTANHALRDGLIKREGCYICEALAEMHHADYTKPLDVGWYCFIHHRKHHKEIYENKELLNGA